MKHIVIKLPLLAIGSGVKLIHTYTTKSLQVGQKPFAHSVVTQVIVQPAARGHSSGMPPKSEEVKHRSLKPWSVEKITLWSSASVKVEKVGKLEIPPLEIRYIIWNQEVGHRGNTTSTQKTK